MPEDRCSLEFLIDEVCRYMVDAGITEHDHELIREAAQDLARLIGAVSGNRPSDVTGFCRQPSISPSDGNGILRGASLSVDGNMQQEEITLSSGIMIAEGWHGIERAADNGQSFRWTSARSCLVVDLAEGAMPEGVNVIFHLGSPAARH